MTQDNHSSRPVALVFGGSRGIGAAAVERLAADGFRVAFTYVSRPDRAEELVGKLAASGHTALAIQADSAEPANIGRAVQDAVERLGPISAIVVNAGIFKMGTIDKVSVEELDEMLNINVRAVFLSIQASLPHMIDGGRVVTIGSNVVHRTGMAGASVYQLTKTAVAGLVKGVALDLSPRKITVNNIQPGPIDTDINSGALEVLAGMSPLKRVGKPAEIAGLISYLVSDEASYVTGASFTIDGGFTL